MTRRDPVVQRRTRAGTSAPTGPPARTTRSTSALRVIWRTPFLRSASVALFISGIGVSSTMPQMTLYLVNELHLPLQLAGLYYLVNLTAPLVGFLLGTMSDRLPNRLMLYRCCAVLGGLGWVAMSFATHPWMPFVIGALVLSVGGAAMGQLFAATRDELIRHPTAVDSRVIATVRMFFSAGWIIGPVAGSWFGATFGLRPLLLATAACVAGQIIPLGARRVDRVSTIPHADQPTAQPTNASRALGLSPTLSCSEPQPATRSRPISTGPISTGPISSRPIGMTRRPSVRPLLAFLGCCVLVMNGDTMKFAYLPLYMDKQLHLSDTLRGAVIAIQPLLELLLMPLAARLADRTSPIRVLMIGAGLGVAAHLAYATSTNATGLIVGQILMSGLWAAVAGLGITVAQQLSAHRIGLASSVYSSSIPLAGALGGSLGTLGALWLGIPHLYFIPAILTAIGGGGLFLIARRHRPDDTVFAAADREP